MQRQSARWRAMLLPLLTFATGSAGLTVSSVTAAPVTNNPAASVSSSLDANLMQMAAERLAMVSEPPALVALPPLPAMPSGSAGSVSVPLGMVPEAESASAQSPEASLPPITVVPQAALAPSAPSPAAAPALAPATVGIIERVGDKLTAEHKRLAEVSQSLLSVNGLVEKTEQSLLGRVLDVETARGLVSKHKAIDAANERAKGQVDQLGGQISSLNELMAIAEKTYAQQAAAQRKAEEALEAELQKHVDALAAQASQAAKQLPALTQLNKRLRAKKQNLQDDDIVVTRKGDAVVKELQDALRDIEMEKLEEARLRKALIDTHNYGKQCHLRAETLEQKLREAVKKFPKVTAAAAAGEMQAEATQKANLQRLRAEMAMLQSEIQRKEHAGLSALDSLTKDSTALNLLETSIITEVRNISHMTQASKQREVLLQKSVQENIGKTEEELGRKKGLHKQVLELHERVSPVVFAALEAENDALNQELDGAIVLVEQSNAATARAFAGVQQLTATEQAQQVAADSAAQAVVTAQEEGKKQLKLAVDQTAESKRKSAALLRQAQEAIAKLCQPKWDVRVADTTKEKKDCDQNKQQLMVVQAQQETLKQTLAAAQTAQVA
eukprot:TRINITY_DN121830_c0_g1_i1.p1 TRINITY_DN121830_c0_g1~~TRINITY_DN121830_c0_g1_i1.p1  ORF type:complete len:613 (-),score=214.72 TRINITY_DN121830_c0_g1_i1:56-1894(-)